jgi:hypothetical protein
MVGERRDAFIGIDVGFAKDKLLPVSVCVMSDAKQLDVLPVRASFDKPPAGSGNVLPWTSRCGTNLPWTYWRGSAGWSGPSS